MWAGVYLNGLLNDQLRKNIERIALTQAVNVRDLQHFTGQSTWWSESAIVRYGCRARGEHSV